jgi:hypothetical protein
VRYDKQYFLQVFSRDGVVLRSCDHHAAGNCQSDLYFEKLSVA